MAGGMLKLSLTEAFCFSMRSIKVNGRSAFYRTDRQTRNEVFLEERIAACDRDDDDDCHRHTGALFWHRFHVLCRGKIVHVAKV